MTALRFTGSVRPRALAAFSPAPRRPGHSPGHRPPESPGNPRPPTRAEPLEPRTLLAAFVVTTPADDGPGSLRQAILSANASPGADTISFALPGAPGAVHTLRPATPLPAISDPLTLDATTQPGYATSPLVELDGSAAGSDADGLTVLAGPTTVSGFAINRFGRHGVFVNNPPEARINRNFVGTDPSGAAALPNGGSGIVIAMNSRSRPTVVVERNIVSGNRQAGIWLSGPSGYGTPRVLGNSIGTNAAGTAAVPNGTFGVLVEGASPMVRDNIISGNSASGVRVVGILTPDTPRYDAFVFSNLIGTNAAGNAAIPNGHSAAATSRDGVTVSGPAYVNISGNTISGNAGNGVALLAEPGNGMRADVTSNLVGTDAAGAAPLGNGADGVLSTGVAYLAVRGNTVSANRGNGVVVANAPRSVPNAGLPSTTIDRNKIGTNRIGDRPLGNVGNGIEIRNSFNVTVGGPNLLAQPPGIPEWEPIPPGTYQNVVSANGGHGIYVAFSGSIPQSSEIRILNNLVGADWRGRAGLGNQGSGIALAGVVGATVGGVHIDEEGTTFRPPGTTYPVGNTIVANGGHGIVLGSIGRDSVNNTFSANSIYANGGLGIDLAANGVSRNDVLDADPGPNRLQNFPTLTRVTRADGQAVVGVRLHSAPLQTFRIELFRSPRPDASGHGEGERFLGAITVTTDANGNATGSFGVPTTALPATSWLSATATDAGGNTSEFSAAVSALSGRPSFRPVYRPPTPDASVAAAAPTTILSEAPTRRGAPPPRGLLT